MKRQLLLLILPICLWAGPIIYPDFTTSMMRGGKSLKDFEHLFFHKQSKQLELFRNIYAHNIIVPSTSDGVPRIIHQIWLGSPVPEKYAKWIQSWQDLEGWEYKLWTEEDIAALDLYNQDLYDSATNYGEKSDIARLEILHRFGGIYVDTDYECLKPEFFEELNRSFDFYIGFEPLEHGLLDNGMFKVCNAVIASKKEHKLVRNFIINMKANYLANSDKWTVEKTGPAYLTREIISYEEDHPHHIERNMYLPTTFFYPVAETEIKNFPLTIFPETAGIHYWAGGWIDRLTWKEVHLYYRGS